MLKIPESDTESQLKKHLRDATQIISNVGSGLGMRADQQSQLAANSLVVAAEHILEASKLFGELRN